jgi:N-acetylmuramoyl-L-alanine amidase
LNYGRQVLALGLLAAVSPQVRAPVPTAVVIATPSGEATIPVRWVAGHAALPAPPLTRILPLTVDLQDGWAVVAVSGQSFRFLLDAPVFVFQERTIPLVSGASLADSTLFLPLEWVTEQLPRLFPDTYRYDPVTARLDAGPAAPVVQAAPPPAPVIVAVPETPVRVVSPPPVRATPLRPEAARMGLRLPHTVVVDAGHGGVDAGNPGYFFPRGVLEKDVTLAIARALRDSLTRRGVQVIMTRASDTLIALGDRASFCHDECDLFVSVHVNSVDTKQRGFEHANGFETYYLAVQAPTAEANRVAAMENTSLRYEAKGHPRDDAMSRILKDLQYNEYLRESAVLANLIQSAGAAVHPGGDHGISQAPFMVLKTAVRPAVLVETGYATNRADGNFLTSSAGQRRLAGAIADGIIGYLRQYEEKLGDGGPGR